MVRDLDRLSPDATIGEETLDQLDDQVEAVEFEAWIGEDDIWRRIFGEASFSIPEEQRNEGGIESGRFALDVTLSAPNQDVSIEALGEGRPIGELLRALGVPPGPGFEGPEPG